MIAWHWHWHWHCGDGGGGVGVCVNHQESLPLPHSHPPPPSEATELQPTRTLAHLARDGLDAGQGEVGLVAALSVVLLKLVQVGSQQLGDQHQVLLKRGGRGGRVREAGGRGVHGVLGGRLYLRDSPHPHRRHDRKTPTKAKTEHAPESRSRGGEAGRSHCGGPPRNSPTPQHHRRLHGKGTLK